MNTGHDGSISTGHSNTLEDMLIRLETMVLSGLDIPLLAIRQQISSAIEIMVHVQKIRGKGRRVINISEVTHMEGSKVMLKALFIYNNKDDVLVRTEHEIIRKEKTLWN